MPAPQEIDIILPLNASEDEAAWRRAAAKVLKVPESKVGEVRLRKHSIDARKKRIKVQLRVEVALFEGEKAGGKLPEDPPVTWNAAPIASEPTFTSVIVGAGPAGLFAALKCLELGGKPIVLERGKDASARRFDLAPILRHGKVVEDSNYCFGEGGAGTFSDGKLYTRAKKRGPVADVYRTFVAHGAPERILVDSHPHIGSNLLPNVVKAMRETIREHGGEVHFGAKVVSFLRSETGAMQGVETASGEEFRGDSVILATGHSARDIYHLLHDDGIRLEQKPFAVGMRIEHSQPLIDRFQYHLEKGDTRHELLPAASYSLATKIEGRGVHSFCMCPGGFIVPAATENDEVVVNGMSLEKRDSPFANSGMVVTVEPDDTHKFVAEHGVLAGLAYQRAIETAAKRAANPGELGQVAPAQRVTDFLNGRDSADLAPTSYKPGLSPARLDELLPNAIVGRMKRGMSLFGRQMHGYVTRDANFVGFETRTSSPVRIPRDRETLEHPEVTGLFPCGEGAGFAGGIVSAALDGMRCAEAAAARKQS